jgi:AraC family transcriptional regulator
MGSLAREIGSFSLELLPRRGYAAAYRADRAAIGFAFETQHGLHAFASDRRIPFTARANGLAFVPAGCDVFSQSEQGGEYLRVALTHDASTSGDRQFTDRIDPAATPAARRLRALLLGDGEPLEIEAMVLRLLERALEVPSAEPRPARWMTPRRLRQIEELIEARLDRKLTVQELAAGLGLSAGFFARAFAAALGQAPHDYVIDRRVARARALLSERSLRLDQVALACGFSSHAHMTATLRSRLGVTPGQLRASAHGL